MVAFSLIQFQTKEHELLLTSQYKTIIRASHHKKKGLNFETAHTAPLFLCCQAIRATSVASFYPSRDLAIQNNKLKQRSLHYFNYLRI